MSIMNSIRRKKRRKVGRAKMERWKKVVQGEQNENEEKKQRGNSDR
jgi:hypothetical protein